MNQPEGHRKRLRERFLSDPDELSTAELLELVLTYAIPRKDVGPIANELLNKFKDIDGVLSASYDDLQGIDGIGEQAAIFIKALAHLESSKLGNKKKPIVSMTQVQKEFQQPMLIEVEAELGPLFEESKETKMRAYVNDEIANTLEFLPKAAQFVDVEAFKHYLEENLPYNSSTTRQRRANYIIGRYFPYGNIRTPLTYFASNCSSENELKEAIFYQVIKVEPFATKIAEEFMWPALPIGYVDREVMREYISGSLPDTSLASQKKIIHAVYKTYTLLSIGRSEGDLLHIQIHNGTLEGFLFVFTSEYPKSGVYSFESLFGGPMRHWMLWDKEWIRLQLYNLQDFGVIAKVSEIDTVRQFTLQLDQMTAIRTYFEHPQRGSMSILERDS